MKPICSIRGGWCIEPVLVTETGLVENSAGEARFFDLPNGMTFEQFMRDYASCAAPIYFVEEE